MNSCSRWGVLMRLRTALQAIVITGFVSGLTACNGAESGAGEPRPVADVRGAGGTGSSYGAEGGPSEPVPADPGPGASAGGATDEAADGSGAAPARSLSLPRVQVPGAPDPIDAKPTGDAPCTMPGAPTCTGTSVLVGGSAADGGAAGVDGSDAADGEPGGIGDTGGVGQEDPDQHSITAELNDGSSSAGSSARVEDEVGEPSDTPNQ